MAVVLGVWQINVYRLLEWYAAPSYRPGTCNRPVGGRVAGHPDDALCGGHRGGPAPRGGTWAPATPRGTARLPAAEHRQPDTGCSEERLRPAEGPPAAALADDPPLARSWAMKDGLRVVYRNPTLAEARARLDG